MKKGYYICLVFAAIVAIGLCGCKNTTQVKPKETPKNYIATKAVSGKVTFIFYPDEGTDYETVFIAGDFNNWDLQHGTEETA